MSKRTFVIGDLHGCYDETMDLLSKCGATENDRIIFAGDLVDRGPDNDKCVDLAMKHEAVLGNHEDKHLWYRRTGNEPLSPNHVATRQQLREEHYKYFESLPLKLALPEHNVIVVHAGVLPTRPLAAQDPYHLLHIQMIRPFDEMMQPSTKSKWPSKVQGEKGWTFWTNLWQGPERIVFGHSVLDKPLLTDHLAGIDGGACWGRELWALDVDAWKVTSVPARKAHLYRHERQRTYLIHGDVSTF